MLTDIENRVINESSYSEEVVRLLIDTTKKLRLWLVSV